VLPGSARKRRSLRSEGGAENLSIGAFVFTLGLAKKVLLPDPIALYADVGFAAPHTLQFLAA
jgi:D-alanyl-lipoteichoic acid acyltransferase DltB (MBOAT superfamily)